MLRGYQTYPLFPWSVCLSPECFQQNYLLVEEEDKGKRTFTTWPSKAQPCVLNLH